LSPRFSRPTPLTSKIGRAMSPTLARLAHRGQRFFLFPSCCLILRPLCIFHVVSSRLRYMVEPASERERSSRLLFALETLFSQFPLPPPNKSPKRWRCIEARNLAVCFGRHVSPPPMHKVWPGIRDSIPYPATVRFFLKCLQNFCLFARAPGCIFPQHLSALDNFDLQMPSRFSLD